MKFRNFLLVFKKAYALAKPYGRRRMAFVFSVVLTQGFFQVVGVTSIFPFLAIAANPGYLRESKVGESLTSLFPDLSDNRLLVIAGMFAMLMLLFSSALTLIGEIIRTRYVQGFGHWLRLVLLKRMIGNPYSYFLKHNTSILLKKTTGDVMAYIGGVLSPLMEGIARLVTVILLVSTLVLLDGKLALIAASVCTLYYLIFFKVLRERRNATSEAMKESTRGAMKEAQQLFGGIKAVKVHGKEIQFIERYGRHSAVQATLAKWMPIYRNSPRYFIEPLAFGGLVALVVIMAAQGKDFSAAVPTLGVMALAGYRLIPNFQMLYGTATGISMMKYSLDEVYDEFKEAAELGEREEPLEQDIQVSPLAWQEAITLKEVTFSYQEASAPVLHDLSLVIPKNACVAFIGETGCGKSTLVDLLLGLHRPCNGEVRIDDLKLTGERIHEWRAGIGYVPQEIFLLDDTVAANIAFGVDANRIDEEQVTRVARVAQISGFIESELPEGYETVVGERGVRLSGGQRQRIGLARALYHNPSLLVLDEATSALDSKTESALIEAVEELFGQTTIVMIAHRLTTVRKADIIFELKEGKVARSGTYEFLGLGVAETIGAH